ncbi:holo-ACP synthase [Staphylococcus canis]|uniref:Holo-[acyl-carrier-protein] synthase n=1 Tax=Staphylococcus canis TaxID=2724942 RepID=A0ABS0T9S3_9STAP|nr:holo-ACP synthase [Staphylococcus canis]MBI5975490.1 holo-ACP synthase [Staphylococcus canis]
MIVGIGIDLVEIPRIRKILKRQPRLPHRILSEGELERYQSISNEVRKIEFLAGRFAVKEAFSKALGTGIGEEVSFQSIHCENDANGKPYIQFDGYYVHVSISHTEHYAVSQVILEKVGA